MGKGAWLYLLSRQQIEFFFPLLNQNNYQVTSQATPIYNCIAWAANASDRWWWPDKQNIGYWPNGVPREETISAFIQAYSLLGYSICNSPIYENGFEKIAIYQNAFGIPTHAARQLPSGYWTSKLGFEEDISHQTLDDLSGTNYGRVAVFMKRFNINFP